MASQKKFGTFSGVLTPSLLTILGVIMYMRLGSVVGNSSSGIIEVQSFNKPVLNIGKRQMGRLKNLNVYNVNAIMEEDIAGID